jgi:hypothetical protein
VRVLFNQKNIDSFRKGKTIVNPLNPKVSELDTKVTFSFFEPEKKLLSFNLAGFTKR